MARYVFYDDETQGAAQLICQVGFVLVDDDGQVVTTYQTLVNPHHDFDSYVVRNIHHITPRMVRSAPDFPQVWHGAIRPALDGAILVAHNARGADLHHIEKSLDAYGQTMPPVRYIDTMDMARELLDHAPYTLASLAARYGVADPAHHDALNDAKVLRLVFAHMLDEGAQPTVRTTRCPEGR